MRWRLFPSFLLLFWPFCPVLSSLASSSPEPMVDVGELVLNPEKVDLLLHSAALFALLQAKARHLLRTPGFPRADAVLYTRCAASAGTVSQLAKCIVPLMRTRDELEEEMMRKKRRRKMMKKDEEDEEEEGGNGRYVSEMDWMGWPHRMGKWLLDNMAKGGEWMRGGGWMNAEADDKEWNRKRKMMRMRSFKWRRRVHHRKDEEEERRGKREAVSVDPVKLVSGMFRMNERQARRAKMAEAKRMGMRMEEMEEERMDLIGGKNVPWYMKPVEQLLGMARRWLSGKSVDSARVKRMKERMMMRRRRMMKMRKRKKEREEKWKNRKKRMMKEEGAKDREETRKEDPEAEEGTGRGRLLKNIAKLQRIRHFFEMVEHCNRYLDRMGQSNSEFFAQLAGGSTGDHSEDPFFRFVRFRSGPSALDSLAEELQHVLRNFSVRSLPILSPRILSLFPEADSGADSASNLLSPTLFSFHREGLFSLPTLFGLISTSESDTIELLDLFMELAGAPRVLDKIWAEIEPRSAIIERELYPRVLRMERLERRWARVWGTFSEEQKRELEQRGYSLMDAEQYRAMYGSGRRAKDWAVTDEAELEEDILKMAKWEEQHQSRASTRAKRAIDDDADDEPKLVFSTKSNSNFSSSSATSGGEIRSLAPFIFTNKLHQQPVAVNGAVLAPRAFFNTLSSPNFMTLNVLSPVAFASSVLSPRAMATSILSPTAFTANILNPNALWSEVLSPKFFHSNIVSPRALAALVLSPRTMLGEVLSPKLIEARVLNPGTFFIGILGPNILQPRVLSPNNFGITVLNPNILSPTILSKGNFTIQVLSPSIMSDDVTPEQLLRGDWLRGNQTASGAGSNTPSGQQMMGGAG